MRLHRLDLTAFLAFAGHESIDFDSLGRAGLFLLQGPTGAGKSSILDAICFALYGHVAGDRPDGTELRSHHAPANVRTEIALELTIAGRRLRILRAPAQERPKLRGEGMTTEAASVVLTELTADGGERPLAAGAQEANDELKRLIGMSREQFRQVVMLPQGGFARVLHADSAEREELLRGLFDVRRFGAVERWLKDEAQSARTLREQAEQAVRETLVQAAGVSGAELPDSPPESWLAGLAAAAETELQAAAADQAAAATALTEARSALATAEHDAELHAAAATAAAAAAAAVAACGPDAAGDPERLRESAARLHEQAGAIRALGSEESGLRAERKAAAEAAEQVTALERRAEAIAGEYAREEAARPGREAALEAARTAAAQLPGLTGALDRARARAEAAAARDRLLAAVTDGETEHARLVRQAADARERWLDLRQAHLDGYAGRLAQQLVDGEPCEVCGATDHPAPHPAAHAAGPAEHDVQQAEQSYEQANAIRDAAAERVATLQTELAAESAIAGAQPLPELAAALAGAERAHAEAAVAAAQVQELTAEHESFAIRAAEHLEAGRRLTGEIHAARAAAEAAARRVSEIEDRLVTARGEHESVTAHADVLTARAQACQHAAETLEDAAGKSALTAAAAHDEAALDAARSAAAAAETTAAAAAGRLALCRERATKLAELAARHARAVTAAKPLIERHLLVRDLHEFADGKAESNRKRMRLTVFVLAARLEQVVAAATLRLERMSRGRYSIVHSDEHRGRKARGGLDIRIVDAHTGRERAPHTLSGGETFYASLALALGLADVITAESGGLRLDTLFIDEGFGTLDDEGTLDDVLDVLDELRAGGRAVGLVSHVRELRDRIGAQLRVEPGAAGSTIVQGERTVP